MDVLSMINDYWTENKQAIEDRIQGWVRNLGDSDRQKKILAAREQFHQWKPLRVYISTSQAKRKGAPTFSLRYCGQEVATLILRADGKLYVSIATARQSINASHFDVPIETSRDFAWDSPEGKKFREHFKKHRLWQEPPRRLREHHLESMIIQEMQRKTSRKFGGTLTQVQPVLLYGRLPFQVPIPFRASEGIPEISPRGGNIDILARRRAEHGPVRLSVWELKRPGQIDHAVIQSYIYAVVLRHMLRSSSKAEWFKLFGFGGRLPRTLDIESVVLLSDTMQHAYKNMVDSLYRDNAMTIDGDRIFPRVAYYSWREGKLELTSLQAVKPSPQG